MIATRGHYIIKGHNLRSFRQILSFVKFIIARLLVSFILLLVYIQVTISFKKVKTSSMNYKTPRLTITAFRSKIAFQKILLGKSFLRVCWGLIIHFCDTNCSKGPTRAAFSLILDSVV